MAGGLLAASKWRLPKWRPGPNGCWDIWRLGHLAAGTFGGWDIWRSGHLAAKGRSPEYGPNGCWDIWRLTQMAVGTNGGRDKWRSGHLAARGDSYKEYWTNGCWDKWLLGHLAVMHLHLEIRKKCLIVLTAKCPNSHLSHQSTAIWPHLLIWPDRQMSQQPFVPSINSHLAPFTNLA